MVAYNFKKQFAPKVQDCSKRQTIRGHRDRHAKPGEAIQLYTGMRTKRCEKLIADPICLSVELIRIENYRWWHRVLIDEGVLPSEELQTLAIADGFNSYADFLAFFKEVHGLPFEGVLIKWDCQLQWLEARK